VYFLFYLPSSTTLEVDEGFLVSMTVGYVWTSRRYDREGEKDADHEQNHYERGEGAQ